MMPYAKYSDALSLLLIRNCCQVATSLLGNNRKTKAGSGTVSLAPSFSPVPSLCPGAPSCRVSHCCVLAAFKPTWQKMGSGNHPARSSNPSPAPGLHHPTSAAPGSCSSRLSPEKGASTLSPGRPSQDLTSRANSSVHRALALLKASARLGIRSAFPMSNMNAPCCSLCLSCHPRSEHENLFILLLFRAFL